MKTIHVELDDDGVRLDRVLRKHLPLSTLSTIYRLVRKGSIRVNGRRVKHDCRLHSGDSIQIRARGIEPTPPGGRHVSYLVGTEFFERNFHIVYEDECLIACDKPTGLVVHAGSGHRKQDTLIDLAASYLHHTSGASVEPFLVHRLDRDTSGIILLAKDKQVLRRMHAAFRSRKVHKRYVAMCHGRPKAGSGRIDLPLARTHGRNQGTKMVVREGGITSASEFVVKASKAGISRIRVDLHTGRTHQIRVHLTHMGCPIIGDVRYGDSQLDRAFFLRCSAPRRLYLHAEQISFFHPELDRDVVFSVPPSRAFRSLWEGL